MHDTAAAFGAAFFRCYADAFDRARILEVGAGDVNGTLRGCAPQDCRYTGIDLAAGPGVDVVLADPYTYPFNPDTYDIVVSSSCLEHDQMFWLSFAEMCRVLSAGGFIYLNVPSNGSFHRYPTDNWRFYPDSGLALVSWARRNGHDIHLVESFIGRRRRDIWNDCVMVFGKGETPRQLSLLAEIFPRSFNIRIGEEEIISNYCEPTEDMTLRAWLTEKLGASSPAHGNDSRTSPIEALIASIAEREVALDATERAAAKRRTAAEAIIAALRGELAAALADRDAAAQAGHAALAEGEARLARADAEAADLRGALGGLRRALAVAKAEIDGLRASVASLEHEAKERTTATTVMRRELASLHAEMQAERKSLHAELAASRQVNRSLLAALRTGAVLAPATGHLVSQPRGIFRLIGYWIGRAMR
jgi:hypothetical protein